MVGSPAAAVAAGAGSSREPSSSSLVRRLAITDKVSSDRVGVHPEIEHSAHSQVVKPELERHCSGLADPGDIQAYLRPRRPVTSPGELAGLGFAPPCCEPFAAFLLVCG